MKKKFSKVEKMKLWFKKLDIRKLWVKKKKNLKGKKSSGNIKNLIYQRKSR